MKVELLQGWLGLPPGDWPPDHYALLGLAPGEGDSTSIEDIALERMELLRPHQIRHQEEVTEGMNRLAQAMACLSDRRSRNAYDISIGLAAEPEPAEPEPETFTVLEANTDEEEPLVLEFIEERVETLEQEPLVLQYEDDPGQPLVISEDELADPPTVIQFTDAEERRAKRRELYAELVKVRRVVRVWDRLRPFLADPEAPIGRRSDAQSFTAALVELNRLLPDVEGQVGGPGEPGHRVALLVRHQLALQTFRGFLPSQRLALTEDWQAGRLELRKRTRLLREEIRSSLRKGWGRRVWAPLVRRVSRSPEWALVPVAAVALVLAAWRS